MNLTLHLHTSFIYEEESLFQEIFVKLLFLVFVKALLFKALHAQSSFALPLSLMAIQAQPIAIFDTLLAPGSNLAAESKFAIDTSLSFREFFSRV
jgi:hypothetical protein